MTTKHSMLKTYATLSGLHELVGQELGTSDWLHVDQARIDAFAAATGDAQWIHVDPIRAASGPFGGTVAHGFLTLSLLPALLRTAFAIEDVRLTINYGLDRVRFPAVLPAGSRVRGRFTLVSIAAIEGGAQLVVAAAIDREGHAKPVCVAESVLRHFV